jgi:hypothetical protein
MLATRKNLPHKKRDRTRANVVNHDGAPGNSMVSVDHHSNVT